MMACSCSASVPMRWIRRPSPTMSPTHMRGLRLPKGSWKTTCISRRNGRTSFCDKPSRAWPWKRMSPRLPSNRRIARPSVDLPEPLSPTIPRV
ncbi:hypothetical protein FQZ97_1070420 [compost metagenome]